MGNQIRNVKIWAKTAFAAVVVILLIAFLLLNMNAVVDPRLHLLIAKYERPSLLLVLLLTWLAGLTVGLLVPAVYRTMRELRQSRADARAIRLEREVDEMHATLNRAAPRSAP
jgi:uncharacterized integral membrane protein